MVKTREINQGLVGLKHEARPLRLAMEADVTPGTKTRERVEDAEADQAKNGNSYSSKRVDAGPTRSTSFGMTVEPPTLLHRDDVLVDKGVEAPKPCSSPVEMSMRTVAGGLLPAGIASTVKRPIVSRPLPSWTLGDETKEEPTGQTTTSFPPSAGGGLFKSNQCILWCLILEVAQIVYAAARCWEGGTRCMMDGLV